MRKIKNRKDQIELVLVEAKKSIGDEESVRAWRRLCNELESMIEPEVKMPRFNRLLRAIWVAATNEQS